MNKEKLLYEEFLWIAIDYIKAMLIHGFMRKTLVQIFYQTANQ